MGLQSQIINTLIVSIPEQLFITFMALRIINENRYLAKDFLKNNIIKIFFISILPLAIFSNTLEYLQTITGIDSIGGIKDISGAFILIPITVIALTGYKNKKEIPLLWMKTFLAFVIFMVIEMGTVLIITYLLDVGVDSLNKTPYTNFLMTILERIIEFVYLYHKISRVNSLKSDLEDKDIFRLMMRNKGSRNLVIVLAFVDFIVTMILGRLVFVKKILVNCKIEDQLIILVIILGLLLGINMVTWLQAVNIYDKEKYIQDTIRGEYNEEDV